MNLGIEGHASYFRRKNVELERTFHTCNLRKSAGFHLVAQGGDPIPLVINAIEPYRIGVMGAGAGSASRSTTCAATSGLMAAWNTASARGRLHRLPANGAADCRIRRSSLQRGQL
jgi:hypothetical protein